ncbi:alginate lyase family protein [Mongoliibacter sp.]|uniref:alginate lyase family protein n=1 Tax=Mongoliibacter sp. TaxID=2022438 RepID=UPI0025D60DAA|nr:alginate lyase family protein [Mongoliibacter sp.]
MNYPAVRSAGGINDFYSEGDYWWPDSVNPYGPYIQKDGMTNPDNFTKHREVMIRFSQISGALGSAYLATGDQEFAEKLRPHFMAWFVDENTLMNPNLLYGQAIVGRVTGRGIGIIDTIHLVEVVKAFEAVETAGVFSFEEIIKIKKWFSDYLDWITSHPYGIQERDHGNNHSVCWAMQAAVFASLVDNKEVKSYCKKMYKETLLPDQMAGDGSFPKELARTKPYGYSLFTMDAMATICQTLSTEKENLFLYTTSEGKNLELGLSFLYPYVQNKNNWPYPQDVMHWNEWPVRHPFLLFGGLGLQKDHYLILWQSLNADFSNTEVIRNMPIRNPLLWINQRF